MKKQIIPLGLCLLGAAAMVLPNFFARSNSTQKVMEDFKDPIAYEKSEDAVVEYSKLNVYRANEDEVKLPNKVILHYFNDDKDCLSRRF